MNNNYDLCIENLEIPHDVPLTKELLKKHYHMMALKYHPDKNKSENAVNKFQEIQNSYEYLKQHNQFIYGDDDSGSQEHEKNNYNNILFSFFKNITDKEPFNTIFNKVFYMIINRLLYTCETNAINILDKLDVKILIKIYQMILLYKDILHVSDIFIKNIEELITNKTKQNECIILNPFIEDLLDDNLYKFTEKGSTYVIPLWHHELVYDNLGNDMYIQCVPLLPENIWIDEKNNIYVEINYKINEIWGKPFIDIPIGSKTFLFPTKDIKLIGHQELVLEKKGISLINSINIYDNSKRADIFIYLDLSI